MRQQNQYGMPVLLRNPHYKPENHRCQQTESQRKEQVYPILPLFEQPDSSNSSDKRYTRRSFLFHPAEVLFQLPPYQWPLMEGMYI